MQESFLGAYEDERLLGAIAFFRHATWVDIYRLVVDPDAFRRGIATRLLDALDERHADADHVTVATAERNAPAVELYERRGFKAVGRTTVAPGIRIDTIRAPQRRDGPLNAPTDTLAAPPSPGTGRRPRRRAGARPAPSTRRSGCWSLACLAAAAVSLLGPSQPTYDPWAWIIWGREITEGALDTRLGPSWKPLPVLFTTPFALFGAAAPQLWLVIARAGGFLAFVFAYRLGARLAGRWAGAIAAFSLLLADEFVRNFWRGNSEGLLVAFVLWAVERHLDGKRGARVPARLRRRAAAPRAVAVLGPLRPLAGPGASRAGAVWCRPRLVACGALWFLPEWWGSGNLLRAAERARQPNPDSAAFAQWPFVEVFRRSFPILMPPVLVGAAIALGAGVAGLAGGPRRHPAARAVRRRRRADDRRGRDDQAGFAGNLRYVALPAALIAVLAGAGWVELVRSTSRRFGPIAAGALALLVARRSSRSCSTSATGSTTTGSWSTRRPRSTASCRRRSPRPAARSHPPVRLRVRRAVRRPGDGLVPAPARRADRDLPVPARLADHRPDPLAGGRPALPAIGRTPDGRSVRHAHPLRKLKPWPPMPRDPRGS